MKKESASKGHRNMSEQQKIKSPHYTELFLKHNPTVSTTQNKYHKTIFKTAFKIKNKILQYDVAQNEDLNTEFETQPKESNTCQEW